MSRSSQAGKPSAPTLGPTLLLIAALTVILTAALLGGCAGMAERERVPETVPEERTLYEQIRLHVERLELEEAIAKVEEALAESQPASGEAAETAAGQPAGDGGGFPLEMRLLYARLLLQAERCNEARRQVMLILDRRPDQSEALFILAVLEGRDGNTERQRELLERVVALDPNHADALSTLGRLSLEGGDLDGAERWFSRTLEADPRDFPATLGLGRIHLARKNYEQALSMLDRAVSIEPEFPFVYPDRARAKARLGRSGDAVADYSRAVELAPDYVWNYLDRGRLYLRMGLKDKAEGDFTRAAQIDRDNFLAYVYLAGLTYEQERWKESLEHYRRVVALREDYPHAYKPLAVLNYRFGHWREAARWFSRAREAEPRNFAYPLMAVLALRRADAHEQAERALESAMREMPRESWWYEVARYLLHPQYESSLFSMQSRRRDRLIRSKMSFYVATQHLVEEHRRTAAAMFTEVVHSDTGMYMEKRLAAWELQRMEGKR